MNTHGTDGHSLTVVLPGTTWQPIATAPKTGRILGYSEKDGQNVWWWVRHIVTDGSDRGSWENISYEWYELVQPTHWMPLPPSPAE